jgi:hypothetical protein
MKQQQASDDQPQKPKLQVVYSLKNELAAVHLISPDGIISYASIGPEPGPSKQKKQDAA